MSAAVIAYLERFSLDSGRREELKWLAAILMVVDHVNGYLLGSAYPLSYELGRLSYPLFALVLAYNLAQADERVRRRVLYRLVIFGIIAQPLTMLLRYPIMAGDFMQPPVWWHGNILFTFAAGVMCTFLIGRDRPFTALQLIAGILLVVLGGALVDFRWAGIAYFLSAYYLFLYRRPSSIIIFALANVALGFENLSLSHLLAIPIVLLAAGGKGTLRRRSWMFYTFYPLHLALIWLASLAY